MSARHAADQNVPVLAVPGPIYAPTSEGTNRLIRDGAAPLLEIDDVLEAAGLDVRSVPTGPQSEPDGLEGRVRAALAEAPHDRDELARRLGCTPAELSVALLDLEVAGRVAADPADGRLRWLGRVSGAGPVRPRRGLSSASRSRTPGGDS